MFSKINKKVAINLVIGSLGAGKTTLLKNFLAQKPENETWGILVNEFGAIGIDGAILSNEHESIKVANIPGGCICCTALSDFQEAIKMLMDNYQLDRVFIEPTGLGEPDSMVELLQSAYFQDKFDVQTVFAVLDSAITKVEQFKLLTIMQNLIDVADVVVLNKTDRATEDNLSALHTYISNLYPPKIDIIQTSQAKVNSELISHISSNKSVPALMPHPNQVEPSSNSLHEQNRHHTLEAKQNYTFTLEAEPKLKGLIERKGLQQLSTLSIGWVFSNDVEFDWSRVRNLFNAIAQNHFGSSSVLRAKGVFKVGEPRMLFQWVKEQEITRDHIAYKRDSRLELLLPEEADFDIRKFERDLASCQK